MSLRAAAFLLASQHPDVLAMLAWAQSSYWATVTEAEGAAGKLDHVLSCLTSDGASDADERRWIKRWKDLEARNPDPVEDYPYPLPEGIPVVLVDADEAANPGWGWASRPLAIWRVAVRLATKAALSGDISKAREYIRAGNSVLPLDGTPTGPVADEIAGDYRRSLMEADPFTGKMRRPVHTHPDSPAGQMDDSWASYGTGANTVLTDEYKAYLSDIGVRVAKVKSLLNN